MAEKVLGFRIEVKGTDKETAQLNKLSAATDQIKARIKLLNDIQRKGTPLTQTQIRQRTLLTTQLKANNAQYNKLNKTILQNNNVTKKSESFTKKMSKSIVGAGVAMFGIGAAIGIVTSGIKGAVKIFVDFEKANSKLEAVLGANETQMASLSTQAKALGSSTAFTATQVTELQTEFAKLGFPTEDILNMTEATLNGAAALGSDLGEQAALTGATLKQYGLDANKAAEVNDILAAAAANSALDFSKLSTALPIVGATANAVGLNLKETTSLLGRLSDRGLDASTSGTSLRNVFLELSKQGLTMNEAMAKINGSTDKAKTSMQLFGKRGATTGLILADMEGVTTKLDEALVNVNGTAKEMSETMLNNLAGDATKAKSAWEGLILSIEDGNNVINSFARSSTKGLTGMLAVLTNINNGMGFVDAFQKVRLEAQGLTAAAERLSETPLHAALEEKEFELAAERLAMIASGADQTGKSFLLLEKKIALVQDKLSGKEGNTKNQDELNDKIIAAEQLAAAQAEADEEAVKANKIKNDKIAADNAANAKKQAEKAKQLEDKLQKDLRKINIQNDTEGREEKRALLELSFQEKLDTITGQTPTEIEFRKAIEEQKRQALQEQQNEWKAIDDEKKLEDTNAALEKEAVSFQAEIERLRAKELLKEQIVSRSLSIVGNIAETASNIQLARFDKDAAKQLETFQGTEEEKVALKEKLDAKREELERKAANIRKTLAIFEIGVNLAKELSAIKANAAANPANAVTFGGAGITQAGILSGLAIISAAANTGLVLSQKFADGGLVEGASHENGGVQMYHKSGQHIGEMEGNEYIMSRKTVERIGVDNLDAMNFGGGSANGFFQDGGSVPNVTGLSQSQSSIQNSFNMEALASLISVQMQEAIVRTPVINNATETASVAANVINIETDLSFG